MRSDKDKIKLYLSRSTYSVNSSIVGTINVPGSAELQANVTSLKVYVAGRSRLDPRWHDVPTIMKLYGTHPCHDELPPWLEKMAEDCCFGSSSGSSSDKRKHATTHAKKNSKNAGSGSGAGGVDTHSICFWSTNVLTLWESNNNNGSDGPRMKVPMVDGHGHGHGHGDGHGENDSDDLAHRPLKMHGSNWFKESSYFIEMMQEYSNEGDMALDHNNGDEYSSSSSASASFSRSDSSSSQSDSDSYSDRDSDSNDSENDYSYEDGEENAYNDDENTSSSSSSQEQQQNQGESPSSSSSDHHHHENSEGTSPMHFTFKVDLPDDIPPTVNAVCARYFYSAVLFAQTEDGKAPFNVVASNKDNILHARSKGESKGNKTTISIGSIHALAHKRPYLLPLTTSYKAEPWSISVKRSQNIIGGGGDPSLHDTVKTIPIGEGEYKCGTLCIVGGGIMSPGERISLQFFFENENEHEHEHENQYENGNVVKRKTKKKILPCYQVSACLQGGEYAIDVHGKKTKTRSYVFSTDHERVYPGTTDGVSLSLSLPLHCPMTIATDFCEIVVTCRIDMTVRTPPPPSSPTSTAGSNTRTSKSGSHNSFRFLTVEFPCQVVQCAPEDEPMENCLSPDLENKLLEMKWSSSPSARENGCDYDAKRTKNELCKRLISSEVLNDLNMLSLHVQNRM